MQLYDTVHLYLAFYLILPHGTSHPTYTHLTHRHIKSTWQRRFSSLCSDMCVWVCLYVWICVSTPPIPNLNDRHLKLGTPIFYKKQHTFWKGFLKKQNLNDFLNRVFHLPLPPMSWYFKGSKMKRLDLRSKMLHNEKIKPFCFLFFFLTLLKMCCFL